jgi:hypothetical protein
MHTHKNSNPFAVSIETEDQSLDSLIEAMEATDKSFDTWYQFLFRTMFSWVPDISLRRKVIYTISDETDEIYIGPQRRRGVRYATVLNSKIASTVATVNMLMMPKTVKIDIEGNEDVA